MVILQTISSIMCASPRRAIKRTEMRTRTIAAITIGIVVLAALAAATRSHVYMILDGGDGRVLWNANEAYLFIGVRHIGHEVNILRFPWFLAKNYLGGVEDPDNDRGSLDVIHVTSSGIEHHVGNVEYSPPGSGPDMYTP